MSDHSSIPITYIVYNLFGPEILAKKKNKTQNYVKFEAQNVYDIDKIKICKKKKIKKNVYIYIRRK